MGEGLRTGTAGFGAANCCDVACGKQVAGDTYHPLDAEASSASAGVGPIGVNQGGSPASRWDGFRRWLDRNSNDHPYRTGALIFGGVFTVGVTGGVVGGLATGTLTIGAGTVATGATVATTVGVPLAQAVQQGLVDPSGKLYSVLGAMEQVFTEVGPTNAMEALDVVNRAAVQVNLEPGILDVAKMTLTNAGGVLTTLAADGSILVTRGSDIVLHLVSGGH
jgi:hypothetical protein